MKKISIILSIALVSLNLVAQESNQEPKISICEAINSLMQEAPNGFFKYQGEQFDERNMNSLLAFPGAYKSSIEMNSGVPVFKAYIEESNDKELLLQKFETVSSEVKSCLGKKYVLEEILQDDSTGKMLIVKHKKEKKNKVKVILEFSKADMSTASYYLRLNVMNEN